MTDLDKLCADLRGMMEKATPGEWRAQKHMVVDRLVGMWFLRRNPDVTLGSGNDGDAPLATAALNALPTLLDALTALQAERDEAVTRLAEVLESLAYRGSLLCRETARADAAQETIGRLEEALGQVKLLLPEGGVRHIPMTPTEDQRNIGRSSDLYQHGDMRLVWVNEGDLGCSSMIATIVRAALSDRRGG